MSLGNLIVLLQAQDLCSEIPGNYLNHNDHYYELVYVMGRAQCSEHYIRVKFSSLLMIITKLLKMRIKLAAYTQRKDESE